MSNDTKPIVGSITYAPDYKSETPQEALQRKDLSKEDRAAWAAARRSAFRKLPTEQTLTRLQAATALLREALEEDIDNGWLIRVDTFLHELESKP